MSNDVQNYLEQYASICHDTRFRKKLLSKILNQEEPEIAGAFFAAFEREYLYDELDASMLLPSFDKGRLVKIFPYMKKHLSLRENESQSTIIRYTFNFSQRVELLANKLISIQDVFGDNVNQLYVEDGAYKYEISYMNSVSNKNHFLRVNRLRLSVLSSDDVINNLKTYFHNKDNYQKLKEDERWKFLFLANLAFFDVFNIGECVKTAQQIYEQATFCRQQRKILDRLPIPSELKVLEEFARTSQSLYVNELFDEIDKIAMNYKQANQDFASFIDKYNSQFSSTQTAYTTEQDEIREQRYELAKKAEQLQLSLLCLLEIASGLSYTPEIVEMENMLVQKYDDLSEMNGRNAIYSRSENTSYVNQFTMNHFLRHATVVGDIGRKVIESENEETFKNLNQGSVGYPNAKIGDLNILLSITHLGEQSEQHQKIEQWVATILNNELKNRSIDTYLNQQKSIAPFVNRYGKPLKLDAKELFAFVNKDDMYNLGMVLQDVLPQQLCITNFDINETLEIVSSNEINGLISFGNRPLKHNVGLLFMFQCGLVEYIDNDFIGKNSPNLIRVANMLFDKGFISSENAGKIQDHVMYVDFLKNNRENIGLNNVDDTDVAKSTKKTPNRLRV